MGLTSGMSGIDFVEVGLLVVFFPVWFPFYVVGWVASALLHLLVAGLERWDAKRERRCKK